MSAFNHKLHNARKKLASSKRPEFIKRLENNEHPNVLLSNGDIATHLLSQVDNYAIPMVQPIDYSNTSLGYQIIPDGFDAARRAFENNDVLRFNSDADAERYTEMYKNYYPNYFSNTDFGSGYVGSSGSPIQIQPITVTPNGNNANWYGNGGNGKFVKRANKQHLRKNKKAKTSTFYTSINNQPSFPIEYWNGDGIPNQRYGWHLMQGAPGAMTKPYYTRYAKPEYIKLERMDNTVKDILSDLDFPDNVGDLTESNIDILPADKSLYDPERYYEDMRKNAYPNLQLKVARGISPRNISGIIRTDTHFDSPYEIAHFRYEGPQGLSYIGQKKLPYIDDYDHKIYDLVADPYFTNEEIMNFSWPVFEDSSNEKNWKYGKYMGSEKDNQKWHEMFNNLLDPNSYVTQEDYENAIAPYIRRNDYKGSILYDPSYLPQYNYSCGGKLGNSANWYDDGGPLVKGRNRSFSKANPELRKLRKEAAKERVEEQYDNWRNYDNYLINDTDALRQYRIDPIFGTPSHDVEPSDWANNMYDRYMSGEFSLDAPRYGKGDKKYKRALNKAIRNADWSRAAEMLEDKTNSMASDVAKRKGYEGLAPFMAAAALSPALFAAPGILSGLGNSIAEGAGAAYNGITSLAGTNLLKNLAISALTGEAINQIPRIWSGKTYTDNMKNIMFSDKFNKEHPVISDVAASAFNPGYYFNLGSNGLRYSGPIGNDIINLLSKSEANIGNFLKNKQLYKNYTKNMPMRINNIWSSPQKSLVGNVPQRQIELIPKSQNITPENAASITPEFIKFHHGSPVRFDVFSADFIGSGEGGSKVMRGINLWPVERIGNAPKFANIKSPDAVTYYDNRVRIPLGKRDNFDVNDINHSIGIKNTGTPYYWNDELKKYDMNLLQSDVNKGKQAALDYLSSDFRKFVDERNTRAAKLFGFGDIGNIEDRTKNLLLPFSKTNPIADKNIGYTAEIARDMNNPALDEITLNLMYPQENEVFHELIHRADVGASTTHRGLSIKQKNNRENFGFAIINKLLKPLTSKEFNTMNKEDKVLYDYLKGLSIETSTQDQLEAAANFLEIGKELGIKYGAKYPGKKKVLEVLAKAENDPNVGGARREMIKFLNKDNPKYIWRALTGGLFATMPFATMTQLTKNGEHE